MIPTNYKFEDLPNPQDTDDFCILNGAHKNEPPSSATPQQMCGQTYNLRWVPNPNITSSDKLICQRDYNGTTDSIVAGIFSAILLPLSIYTLYKGAKAASTTKSKRKKSKRKRSKKNSCIKERSIVDNPLTNKGGTTTGYTNLEEQTSESTAQEGIPFLQIYLIIQRMTTKILMGLSLTKPLTKSPLRNRQFLLKYLLETLFQYQTQLLLWAHL